jgi:hypothetical protein
MLTLGTDVLPLIDREYVHALTQVQPHTSHVTRHTSHVTRHTSRVTRQTSHVTRRTSHVTRHTWQKLCARLKLRPPLDACIVAAQTAGITIDKKTWGNVLTLVAGQVMMVAVGRCLLSRQSLQ